MDTGTLLFERTLTRLAVSPSPPLSLFRSGLSFYLARSGHPVVLSLLLSICLSVSLSRWFPSMFGD